MRQDILKNTVLDTLLTFSSRLLNTNFAYVISSFIIFYLPFKITEDENS